MNHDFEDVEIKSNAIEILENQLKRKRKPSMVGTGGMCDPYIPIEKDLLFTRRTLELIEMYGYGIAIQTKSADILRDLDVLKRINEKTKCVVQMTLTTYDEQLCSILEPNVSSTKERVEVLNIMKQEGIPTVVWLCPILPFINDTEDNLYGILNYCITAQIKGILCFGFGTTMRDGSREYFYSKLDEHFKELKQKYIETYRNSYECLSPNNDKLYSIFVEECKKNNIMYNTSEIFSYLKEFEQKSSQMSLF